MAPTSQPMTQTNTDTQIDIDTLACQHLGIKQCDLNRIKAKQFKNHGYDFRLFPNVVIHDNDSFDPVQVVSEYLRFDPDDLRAVKDKYASAYSKRRECARECYKRKMAKLSDEERKALYKCKSRDYYSKHADLVKERNLSKYKNDEEYRLRLSLQSKDKYQQKKIKRMALSVKSIDDVVDDVKTDTDTTGDNNVDVKANNDTHSDNKVDVKTESDTHSDNKVDVKTETNTHGDNKVETKPKTNNNKIQVSYESLLNFEPPECTKLFRGITKDLHKYRIDSKHPKGPRLEINDIYLNNDGVRYEYCDWKD